MKTVPRCFMYLSTGLQLVAMFGEVVQLSWGSVSLGTDFETNSLEPLPVHAPCFVLAFEDVGSQLPAPAALPAACPVLLCHDGRIPLAS